MRRSGSSIARRAVYHSAVLVHVLRRAAEHLVDCAGVVPKCLCSGADDEIWFLIVSDGSSVTRPSVCCRTTTKFENFRRLVLGCIDADSCK